MIVMKRQATLARFFSSVKKDADGDKKGEQADVKTAAVDLNSHEVDANKSPLKKMKLESTGSLTAAKNGNQSKESTKVLRLQALLAKLTLSFFARCLILTCVTCLRRSRALLPVWQLSSYVLTSSSR